MMGLVTKICFASVALRAAAGSLHSDEEALIQTEVHRSYAEDADHGGKQFPNFPGFPGLGGKSAGGAGGIPGLPAGFTIPGLGGSSGAGGMEIPGMPGVKLPQISMEDMMKIMTQVVELLRNATVVEVLSSSINETTHLAFKATREMNERYAAFNASVHSAARKDVIPLAVNFMEGEMDALKPQMHEYTRSVLSLIRKLPLGKKGLQAKMMIAMAEPMLVKGFEELMQPLKNSIEVMGNKSIYAFCEGAEPLVLNASSAVPFMQKVEVELKKVVGQLPMLKMTPMSFMMPDVVPVLIHLGEKTIDANQASLAHFETMATNLNTTFRWALNEKLDCDIVIARGAAAPRGLGVLAAVAALAAWLAL
mmetsp:Transcript_89625/g.238063  ORF Transcript_89625/g.238063 Transcript_89625/m.238063 type:complete len:364 (-) Transcript_89625:83-1174(-)